MITKLIERTLSSDVMSDFDYGDMTKLNSIDKDRLDHRNQQAH